MPGSQPGIYDGAASAVCDPALDAQRNAVRDRIGRVGVWTALFGLATAAEERSAIATVEELGYGALWYGETLVGKESLVHGGLLLAASEQIVIASGIASIYARDALAMIAGASALAEAYPGRFILGIGASHPRSAAIRGHEYRRPIATMTSYLDAMSQAQLGFAPPESPVPVMLAALRRRMLELARDRTFGAHPYFTTPSHTARARSLLGPGPLLAPEQMVVLDTDPVSARASARAGIRDYVVAPFYVRNLLELGFQREDFLHGGSDRLVDAIVAWGDVDAITTRVRAHHAAGADHVCIQPLATNAGEQLRVLRALAGTLL